MGVNNERVVEMQVHNCVDGLIGVPLLFQIQVSSHLLSERDLCVDLGMACVVHGIFVANFRIGVVVRVDVVNCAVYEVWELLNHVQTVHTLFLVNKVMIA